jgi:molybdopterin synthase catalytic subunit
MNFVEFVTNFKKNIDYEKTGMILFHNGVVRGTSRDGGNVSKVKVKKDEAAIKKILEEFSFKKGISKIDAVVFEGEISVGEDLMFAAVAGDIRENVFPVLRDFVNKIKKYGVKKEEI